MTQPVSVVLLAPDLGGAERVLEVVSGMPRYIVASGVLVVARTAVRVFERPAQSSGAAGDLEVVAMSSGVSAPIVGIVRRVVVSLRIHDPAQAHVVPLASD